MAPAKKTPAKKTPATDSGENKLLKKLEAMEQKIAQLESEPGMAPVSDGPSINDLGESKTYVAKFPNQLIHVPTGLVRNQRTNEEPKRDIQFRLHRYTTDNLKEQKGIEEHPIYKVKIWSVEDAPNTILTKLDTGGPKYTGGNATTADNAPPPTPLAD